MTKRIKKCKKLDINDNIIRKLSYYLYKQLNLKYFNKYYSLIHNIFIFMIAFIFIFSTNLFFLSIVLLIISLDAFSIVVLHMCPLTQLETKYLKKSLCKGRCDKLCGAGILYNCTHEYEKQIELMINIWLLISGKCLIIIFLRTFNIKIYNTNLIYAN